MYSTSTLFPRTVPPWRRCYILKMPIEIVTIIIKLLSTQDSKSLSRANRAIRQLCIPVLFETVHVRFSEASFANLEDIALSSYAPLVRNVRYEAVVLLNNTTHPKQKVRDFVHYSYRDWDDDKFLNRTCDTSKVQILSLRDLDKALGQLQRLHRQMIKKDRDLKALNVSLPRLSCLESFSMSIQFPTHPMLNFDNYPALARRMSLLMWASSERHFTAVTMALGRAKTSGVAIRKYENHGHVGYKGLKEHVSIPPAHDFSAYTGLSEVTLEGFRGGYMERYVGPPYLWYGYQGALGTAAATLKVLNLSIYPAPMDHPLGNLFQHISFPALNRLAIYDTNFPIYGLEALLDRAPQLKSLELREVVLRPDIITGRDIMAMCARVGSNHQLQVVEIFRILWLTMPHSGSGAPPNWWTSLLRRQRTDEDQMMELLLRQLLLGHIDFWNAEYEMRLRWLNNAH